MHSQQMFNECIARHLKNRSNIFSVPRHHEGGRQEESKRKFPISFSPLVLLIVMFIVFRGSSPPSSGLGEGIEGHRTASSFEVLRRI